MPSLLTTIRTTTTIRSTTTSSTTSIYPATSVQSTSSLQTSVPAGPGKPYGIVIIAVAAGIIIPLIIFLSVVR